MISVQVAVVCLVGFASGTAFVVNETTHGGMAEFIGFGHHHLSDSGGYHCVDHASLTHVQHMHNGTATDHSHCPGGLTIHGDGHRHSHGGMHG